METDRPSSLSYYTGHRIDFLHLGRRRWITGRPYPEGARRGLLGAGPL
ncbi:MAG: hypothetical protein QJR01_01170 [Kyrpidia sp.]|nr:hypothetical protein [Kyrpidia sp.]